MDATHHRLADLFCALKLPSDHDAILRFTLQFRLAPGQSISSAWFWSMPQAEFLREAPVRDAHWRRPIARLSRLLTHH